MTNQEILKKAIEKAEKNGFGYDRRPMKKSIEDWYGVGFIHPRVLLFDHDFAKAFWGEELTWDHHCNRCECMDDDGMPVWQYNLQQLVLEDDPIKYLEQFLDI